MQMQQTAKLEMAARFINSTNSHLFVTGKADTGKTTFLRKLATENRIEGRIPGDIPCSWQ